MHTLLVYSPSIAAVTVFTGSLLLKSRPRKRG